MKSDQTTHPHSPNKAVSSFRLNQIIRISHNIRSDVTTSFCISHRTEASTVDKKISLITSGMCEATTNSIVPGEKIWFGSVEEKGFGSCRNEMSRLDTCHGE